ncbi:MAG TPA: DUF2946 family protein [Caulobacteraceae bacterium]|nr:DUF2946 family protein [Caulobacteraceae bacterium]
MSGSATPRGRLHGLGRLAALFAVALLSFATVRSLVMQAAAGSGQPICSTASGAGHGASGAGKSKQAVCSFCAAAAHPPVSPCAAPVLAPSAVVWRPDPPAPAKDLHARPTPTPKARGPPGALQPA